MFFFGFGGYAEKLQWKLQWERDCGTSMARRCDSVSRNGYDRWLEVWHWAIVEHDHFFNNWHGVDDGSILIDDDHFVGDRRLDNGHIFRRCRWHMIDRCGYSCKVWLILHQHYCVVLIVGQFDRLRFVFV